jgi:hypothetical protein
MYSLSLIIFVVSEKKAFEHFPIGSNVNLCIAPRNDHWKILYKFYVFMSIGNPRWPPPQYIDLHWTLWENVQMPSSQKLQILIIFIVSEKKAFEHFPIGSNVNLCIAVAAILDFRSA